MQVDWGIELSCEVVAPLHEKLSAAQQVLWPFCEAMKSSLLFEKTLASSTKRSVSLSGSLSSAAEEASLLLLLTTMPLLQNWILSSLLS